MNKSFFPTIVTCLMTNKTKEAFRRGDRIFLKANNAPDSGRLILEDDEGMRYRRVVVPGACDFWTFEQV